MPHSPPGQPGVGDAGSFENLAIWVQCAMIIVMFGKAAIGGAGLTLALLGAINAVSATVSHSWVACGPYLPYLVGAGAVANGIWQVASSVRRAA